jgi:MinD-like ATPase involved in chromosome partitioning or flagellar assembly
MITFDTVLQTLLNACEAHPAFGALKQLCAVRDLKGRVRLAVEPDRARPAPDYHSLEGVLKRELGRYFVAPILSTEGEREQARLARAILDQSEDWPAPWPQEVSDPISGRSRPRARGVWRALERVLSKQTWLDRTKALPPWPLQPETPAVVAFYSFKGGVGRTTLLAAVAWHLARQGKRVVAIDLDLEAPGLASLLKVDTPRGALDYIVDHIATGTGDLTDCFGPPTAMEDTVASQITVLPAGATSWSYLEKLARLDYAGSALEAGTSSPVADAMVSLLKAVRTRFSPDYVLVDSRSGLHDLGGLSLHGLSHVDILIIRANEQAYQGLDLTLQALVRRKRAEELTLLVVHAFAPLDERVRAEEEPALRERVYEIFVEHLYETASWDDDTPSADDDDRPHYPVVISDNPALARLGSFDSVDAQVWDSSELQQLCRRTQELCQSVPAEDEEGAGEP